MLGINRLTGSLDISRSNQGTQAKVWLGPSLFELDPSYFCSQSSLPQMHALDAFPAYSVEIGVDAQCFHHSGLR